MQAVITRTGRRLRVCAGVGCNVLGLFAAALEKPNVLEKCEVLPPPFQGADEKVVGTLRVPCISDRKSRHTECAYYFPDSL